MSLCPESAKRAAMSDEEFWDYVLGVAADQDMSDEELLDIVRDQLRDFGECKVCGERGACAYDAEGRPMIHTDDDPEEVDE